MRKAQFAASVLTLVVAGVLPALAAEKPVRADGANAIAFDVQEARFVRFVVFETDSGSQPCVDELEVYGPESDENLALASKGGNAAASSCLSGYTAHTVEHLNDGEYGNDHSWISAGVAEEWAQIELPEPAAVSRVVFSRDRKRQYSDRMPVHFEVRLSMDGEHWTAVKRIKTNSVPVALRAGGPGGFAGIVPGPPPPPRAGAVEAAQVVHAPAAPVDDAQLRLAFLGEEHAWLKTYGRADLSPRLVPYNGRVKEYPRHVEDDRLPLPCLTSAPKLDGVADDPCWTGASRGMARVASPYDFDKGPLANHAVTAGWHDEHLYLHLEFNQLLSSHLAVVSTADGQGCGVLAQKDDGLVFEQYVVENQQPKLESSAPVEGAFDDALTQWEVRLPLALFPECRELGLRVGLGLGGKHTNKLGRSVSFVFSDLSIAQTGNCVGDLFQVRIGVQAPMTVRGNGPGIENGIALTPGDSTVLAIPGENGAIGPEYALKLKDDRGEEFVLHLFRYDPAKRALDLMDEMLTRFTVKGLDVRAERGALSALRERHATLMGKEQPDHAAEREAFFEARMAKRQLFFREPGLEPAESILFAKRWPFEPSHNYSVLLDSAYRPGGAIARLRIPREGGRLRPEAAAVEHLFESVGGIARTPMADFALEKIYFAYRPAKDGYYHIMAMNPDGSGLRQLTDGPYHDFWPCPLPDGDLAVISTRCRMRFLCWRPQAFVLFRMDPEGQDFRPLSYANLSEWAPSVMSDGRIVWTRSEYQDKGADFGHTLWAIRPDGTEPELVFGNDIIQPNGYANGREVPGTNEFACTLISHFGDLNGPIALVDTDKGRFNPEAITSLTPEVPWPGMWPSEECFRDPVPIARDYFLCSHAPQDRFAIFVIDRFGNRELLYTDRGISCMCPTPYRVQTPPPVLASSVEAGPDEDSGEFVMRDVYAGISPPVERGAVKYLRVVEEVRDHLEVMPDGRDRDDHPDFLNWYASPVDLVSGPHGWPTYVAKAPHGLVPVEMDGSAHFKAPAGKVLYFQALDENLNEIQRMRSVVQLQPGEKRSCIGCHEPRNQGPPNTTRLIARGPVEPQLAAWEGVPLSYEKVVQPVLDNNCAECHGQDHKMGIDLRGTLDKDKVPASYRTLISKGLVHYADMGWNSGGCEKVGPLSLGTVKSRLWQVLDDGHHNVQLNRDEILRIKTWIDMNCPLWPDYINRNERPGPPEQVAKAE